MTSCCSSRTNRYDPVVRLVEEAADDPNVLAIKQILYRTSRNSPIVAALEARRRGKQVTAIVELKARFDEARNIGWARNWNRLAVQVIYGVKGLKTHAKVCIVLRREPHGIQRYVHYGTGNYNEITSKLYSDISFMTCDEALDPRRHELLQCHHRLLATPAVPEDRIRSDRTARTHSRLDRRRNLSRSAGARKHM